MPMIINSRKEILAEGNGKIDDHCSSGYRVWERVRFKGLVEWQRYRKLQHERCIGNKARHQLTYSVFAVIINTLFNVTMS